MEKLKITSLRKENQEDSDANVETCDTYFKFKLMVEELLTIFTKRGEKCGICVEYIVKLCQHIGQTHDSTHEHDQASKSSDFKRHRESSVIDQSHDQDGQDKDSILSQCIPPTKARPSLNFPERTPLQISDLDNTSSTSFHHTPADTISVRTCRTGSHKHSYPIYHGGKEFNVKKKYKCVLCGLNFRWMSGLTRHILTHTGEKPVKCDECGKSFARHCTLTLHKRTHTGEKSFKCDECGKSFARQGTLRLHKRTHTGEKSFQCEECGNCFARSWSLRTHTKLNRCKGLKSYHDNNTEDSVELNDSLPGV